MDIEQKRRLVRGLLNRMGRGVAEESGFGVTNNPASLFQLLCLSVLLSARGDYQRSLRAARAMPAHGWDSAGRMAASRHDQRTRVLRDAGYRRAGEVANVLGDLARAVVDTYRGDLRRLRAAARRDPRRERELLTRLPGVTDRAADLFFREVQTLWDEVAPFADRRALTAARKLGLGRSAADLAELAHGTESERLAWLVGDLARVDLDGAYDEVRKLAHA